MLQLDYTGRVVLVTGGTKGVGLGITTAFAEAGASVVTCGRNEPAAGSVPGDFVAADVREPDQVNGLVDGIVERYGRLDVAVNNAGGAPWADSATASPRFNEGVIRLNLLAPLFVSQAANRVMQEQESGGVIVNIGSVSGRRPSPGTAAYGAAKAGVRSLTQTLALEWAPKVRVVSVVGGLIRTEQSHLFYGDEEGVQRVARTVPLGRMGEPIDVGYAAVFVASPLASYLTGVEVELSGGDQWPTYLAAARNDEGHG